MYKSGRSVQTEYLVQRVKNQPTLGDLTLGNVDIYRNFLPSIFLLKPTAYDGPHLASLSDFSHHPLSGHVNRGHIATCSL